jgi:hypothetical protein
MVEVRANYAVTKVSIALTEADASRLRKLLQTTVLWQDSGVIGKLAEDIDTALDALDITTSPVELNYSVAHAMFVEKVSG